MSEGSLRGANIMKKQIMNVQNDDKLEYAKPYYVCSGKLNLLRGRKIRNVDNLEKDEIEFSSLTFSHKPK